VLGYAHVDRATMFAAARRLGGAIRESVASRTDRSRLLEGQNR
jgi:diketogulonate reductase-like aldo/keto reductase